MCLSKVPNECLFKNVAIYLPVVGKAWKIGSWLGEMCSVVLHGFLMKSERLKVRREGQTAAEALSPEGKGLASWNVSLARVPWRA